MFKITVKEEPMEDISSWDGSLNFMKRMNDRHFDEIKSSFTNQIAKLEKLEGKMNEFTTRDVSKMIYSSQAKTGARFDQIESKLSHMFDKLEDRIVKSATGVGVSNVAAIAARTSTRYSISN